MSHIHWVARLTLIQKFSSTPRTHAGKHIVNLVLVVSQQKIVNLVLVVSQPGQTLKTPKYLVSHERDFGRETDEKK